MEVVKLVRLILVMQRAREVLKIWLNLCYRNYTSTETTDILKIVDIANELCLAMKAECMLYLMLRL